MLHQDLNELGIAIENEHGWMGMAAGIGGGALFDQTGRDAFILALENGLLPRHYVLDVGCGMFRLGYWFTYFLAPGRYFGTEVRDETAAIGRKSVLGKELIDAKKPTISIVKDGFDFSKFGKKFDFVIARSIWSHTSKGQMQQFIENFYNHSTPSGVLLASFYPAISEGEEYQGAKWSGNPIRHSLASIYKVIKPFGLQLLEIQHKGPTGELVQKRTRQHWLRIGRPEAFRN